MTSYVVTVFGREVIKFGCGTVDIIRAMDRRHCEDRGRSVDGEAPLADDDDGNYKIRRA